MALASPATAALDVKLPLRIATANGAIGRAKACPKRTNAREFQIECVLAPLSSLQGAVVTTPGLA